MRMSVLAFAAAIVAFVGTTSAEARRYEAPVGENWSIGTTHRARLADHVQLGNRKLRAHRAQRAERVQLALREQGAPRAQRASGGRPRQWCGWWMRTQRGGGQEMNLAWNWSRWGSHSGPQVGAVVVWRHHVGEIVGRGANGQWIVRSGNDGGRVRERARSVAGAVFRMG